MAFLAPMHLRPSKQASGLPTLRALTLWNLFKYSHPCRRFRWTAVRTSFLFSRFFFRAFGGFLFVHGFYHRSWPSNQVREVTAPMRGVAKPAPDVDPSGPPLPVAGWGRQRAFPSRWCARPPTVGVTPGDTLDAREPVARSYYMDPGSIVVNWALRIFWFSLLQSPLWTAQRGEG